MRRRPLELWCVAVLCVARAVTFFLDFRVASDGYDRAVYSLIGSLFLLAPILLLSLQTAGRILTFSLMGFALLSQCELVLHIWMKTGSLAPRGTFRLLTSVWACVYLQLPSTLRLFETVDGKSFPIDSQASTGTVSSLVHGGAALLAGWIASALGASLWVSGGVALAVVTLNVWFLEDWLKRRWELYFARPEAGFPNAEIKIWRSVLSALSREKLAVARGHFERLSAEAKAHPSGELLGEALGWRELIERKPADGRAVLQRALMDHEFEPDDADRKKLLEFATKSNDDELHRMCDERALFIDRMVLAAGRAEGAIYPGAQSVLARVTGENFAFSTAAAWAEWWSEKRADWSGDAGPVAAVARLLMRDCHAAATQVARKTAGRAEEPLLIELAGQMHFFVSIRESGRAADMSREFLNAPLNVLLVPEWADAVGWLHADSPVLNNLGINRKALARRLALRVRLLDYAEKFWRRYPSDLNADLPWLLPLLSGKNFGVLSARSRFDAWWPGARESQLRFGRAMIAGLEHFENDECGAAEKEFLLVLRERPGDLSARYNLALCRLKCNDRLKAEQLLRELTALEPKEPYWWMALGDLHRSANEARPARDAYKRAQELGAAEGRVALHLGLTFAHEDRHGEAIQQLNIALGKNPTPSKLEALAMTLENEGYWKLAGHYREEALRKELDGPPEETRGGTLA